MKEKLNCWEFMDCGYAPGGDKVELGGICPVLAADTFHGINHGTNGGRYCWHVKDAFCQTGLGALNEIGTLTCVRCEFYRYVQDQEAAHFKA